MKGHRFDPGPGHLANDEVASAPFLTSFDRTAHEARDEVLTQGDVHHNGRQTGNEHTSHDLRIIRVLSGSQRIEAEGDRPVVLVSQEQRKEEVVPGTGELPNERHDEAWNGHR